MRAMLGQRRPGRLALDVLRPLYRNPPGGPVHEWRSAAGVTNAACRGERIRALGHRGLRTGIVVIRAEAVYLT